MGMQEDQDERFRNQAITRAATEAQNLDMGGAATWNRPGNIAAQADATQAQALPMTGPISSMRGNDAVVGAANILSAPAQVAGRVLKTAGDLGVAAISPAADRMKSAAYGLAGFRPANPTQYTDQSGNAVRADFSGVGDALGAPGRAVAAGYRGVISSMGDAVPIASAAPAPPGTGATPDISSRVTPAAFRNQGSSDALAGRGPWPNPQISAVPTATAAPAARQPGPPGVVTGRESAPLGEFNPLPTSGTLGADGMTDAQRMNAPWAALNRQFDDRKAAENAAAFQMADYQMRLAQAMSARATPRGGDRLQTQTFANGQTVLGGEAAVAARNAANPLPAPFDATGAVRQSMQAQELSGQRENRQALAAGEISKMGAETGKLRAETAGEQVKTAGWKIDNQGKLVDNEGKVIHNKLLEQNVATGKLTAEGQAMLNSLVARRASATDQKEIANLDAAILAAHGKAGENWKLQHFAGGLQPDPANPGMQIKSPDWGIAINSLTGEKQFLSYGDQVAQGANTSSAAQADARKAVATGKLSKDEVNKRLTAAGYAPI